MKRLKFCFFLESNFFCLWNVFKCVILIKRWKNETRISTIIKRYHRIYRILTFHHHLEVCLCDLYSNFPQSCTKILETFAIHPNSYCSKVKSTKLNRCLHCQKQVKNRCKKSKEPFFGTCHAGVSEYVFPIIENDVYYGFVGVSGYRQKPTKKYDYMSDAQFTAIYKKSLKKQIPPLEEIQPLIAHLVHSLKLLTYYIEPEDRKLRTHKYTVYREILRYLGENYHRTLSLATIASDLHYSVSYISHIFLERAHTTIMQHLQGLKIKKATALLKGTDKSVLEISELVGFEDSNYFSNVFKKKMGISPREYRKQFSTLNK